MSTPATSTETKLERLVARLGTVKGWELVVDGHPISEVAAQVGTPFYLYRGEALLQQVAALREALGPKTELFFSIKANPSVALCQVLQRAGVGAELASIGELEVARAAGFEPKQVIFAGPGKTQRELAAAVRWGIGAVNVESLGELKRLIAEARAQGKRQTVCLRINPRDQVQGAQMRMGGAASQFGLDEDLVPEAVALVKAAPDAVDLAGLHVYAGSQMTDVEAVLKNCEHGLQLAGLLDQCRFEQLARRRLVEGHGIAAGSRIFRRHLAHQLELVGADAEVGERVRNAKILAQLQNPIGKAVEATLDAEVGAKPFDLVLDRGAVELQHVGHEQRVRHAVVLVVERSHRMRQRVHGAERLLERCGAHGGGRHHVRAGVDVVAVLGDARQVLSHQPHALDRNAVR